VVGPLQEGEGDDESADDDEEEETKFVDKVIGLPSVTQHS
jgi:hypothetical protein